MEHKGLDITETSIEYLKGVGPARAKMLRQELNIHTFHDLLSYFPFRYVDRSKVYQISEVTSDTAWIQVKGKLVSVQKLGKPRSERLVAWLQDDTGTIELVWFKGIRWIEKSLKTGEQYVVFGKPNWFNGKLNLPHPEMEPEQEWRSHPVQEKLQPVYSSTEKLKSKGLDSKGIRKLMMALLPRLQGHIPECLPQECIEKYKLTDRETALMNIHFPPGTGELEQARRRLKFEELFFIQLNLLQMKLVRLRKLRGYRFGKVGDLLNRFYREVLPFELTGAQKKVIREIRTDMNSGFQMNRLLQGDVGSGKTLVALMSMLIALDNGFQACLMAPTEILAQQHFNNLSGLLEPLPVHVGLLTGSTKQKQRKALHELLQNGDIHILIGTHALIEDSVQFSRLGLVVIDEQHRFGVAQRARLWKKADHIPHVLVMTATPIPRTLAMTLYGDLDVSVIDELPPGRKPVKTLHFTDRNRLRLFGFMREQIKEGRQVYVVYPLISESEKLDLKHLEEGYESLSRAFPLPEYAIGVVHGRMSPQDKAFEMERFAKGQTQILVSTTVIEVGVDVPNATVMVIENAERFGLSQLHQLRGRVGRGGNQSYCILVTGDKLTNDGRERIETMVRTNNGFEIAEADLRLRGPGEMHGTRQSGMLTLNIADIVRDEKILRVARDEAAALLEKDPDLAAPESARVKSHLRKVNRNNTNWSLIS
ncbi:MAG: ATP-dependent DNA helicase RecG [Bacteroidales bacterium]